MKRAFFLAFSTFCVVLAPSAARAGGIRKGPWTQRVTPHSAVVRIEVDPPAPVTLELGMMGPPGTTDSGIGSVIESREVRALHSILVQNLEPATRYPFTVRVSGAQRYGALTTAPAEDSGTTFRFLIYGDTRSDDTAHASVVRAMEVARSDFVVYTGDLVENGASPSQWQAFFDIEAPITRERPIFATVGNHELTDGAGMQFVRYFGSADVPAGDTLTLDQLSGTFRWANTRFFLINGMVNYSSGAMRAWLDKVLTDSDTEPGLVWRIVVVHHGLWSSGPHGNNPLLHEAKLPELLRAHKVDLVISGHDHIYERGFAEGLAYLVSGGGGAPVYRVKKAQPTSRRYESVRHFIEASVSGVGINFVATRTDTSIIEQCALRKGAGWDCDGEKSEIDASPPTAATAATPSSGSKCGCRAVGDSGDSSSGVACVLMAIGAAAIAARSRRRFVR